MRKISILLAMACALPLSACASVSFAPPGVSVKQDDTGRRASSDCLAPTTGGRIPHTVPGAQLLIDNFVDAYRCARSSAANGRQIFEVPSYLALIGGATAAALGAGKDVAILTGAANATLTGGKAYYAPKDKARLFDLALDATYCIKTASVGVDAYNIGETGKRQVPFAQRSEEDSKVRISVDQQYYVMIEAALLSVERILARQLSDAGSPVDAAGIAAQIRELAQQERDARSNAGGSEGGVRFASDSDEHADLQLKVLKVELDKCVVRAKMA